MTMTSISKVRLATVWLDGCSGCHMSLLDTDERLIGLAEKIDVVYSPLVDFKEFPRDVDVTLVEGAVSSDEDLEKIRCIRQRTRILISLGDCAVTANVPSMRNPFGVKAVMQRVYGNGSGNGSSKDAKPPTEVVPLLLKNARPVHAVVKVDVFVPGCPPSADTIFFVLGELLEGHQPAASTRTRFGA